MIPVTQSEKPVAPFGAFQLHRCGACGFKFQTREGLAAHRRVHRVSA